MTTAVTTLTQENLMKIERVERESEKGIEIKDIYTKNPFKSALKN